MGGSYIDSACRLFCTIIAMIVFAYFAFYRATTYRDEHGLLDCFSVGTEDVPIDKSGYRGKVQNTSENFRVLFYLHFAGAIYNVV